ncbi:hypothetical protein VNO78_26527 [Psophocarpus tetragonolobus]|uniref:Uncharacterized protein n=1 Tax=Psophocarpus tetragonolobus TaxID=3891 RepID=A0AAN9RZH8_PSOTE
MMKVNTGFVMSCTGTCFSKERKMVKNSTCTCQKLGGVGVASWLCQCVASVFFASLEWCSCFYVDTSDGPDPVSTSAPLILNPKKEDSASATSLIFNHT